MATYSVKLYRVVRQEVVIQVEADSEEEAVEKADKAAHTPTGEPVDDLWEEEIVAMEEGYEYAKPEPEQQAASL